MLNVENVRERPVRTRLVAPTGERGCYKSGGTWIPMCWTRVHDPNDCSCYREVVPRIEDEHEREASRLLWAFKEAHGDDQHIERAKIAAQVAGKMRQLAALLSAGVANPPAGKS